MLVDDEPINIKAAVKHLKMLGFCNFVSTSDSTRAFAMACRERPDLLLLDIVMPEVGGLELLQRFRSDARFVYMPIIVLTAFSDPSIRQRALDLGATEFLAKPIEPNELRPRIRNVLFVKAYQDELAARAQQLQQDYEQQGVELLHAQQEGELRYLAGKAEIATDVLHNVGNALNSVNVGVSLVGYTARESKVHSLQRAVALLEENRSSLAKFLTKDERGLMLPSYLVELTDLLLKEQERIVGEVKVVEKHLEFINSVVAAQQKYAAMRQPNEAVSLAEVLDDVESLLGGANALLGVEICRHVGECPALKTDRQGLLQVLINVLKNAIESARQQQPLGQARLELKAEVVGEMAHIEVKDNGIGIAPENTENIFAHGFTTKPDGHGFGLHSCATIMTELGGSLRCSSEGIGHGATFTLELPIAKN